ncbi:hypothetical protein SAMD00019534_072290 [Acytostelium subglobosum LB1]|uniref:hypothetical protein n=1 Tax=Acytostelium subglobosum LB1 TaxID=1410327 RepID=UPI000644DF16|nr:hypothetical protein SAMD00019534_072290 [Acytostelium subglobosum LB1]GAM24054.1 hypothetical protein SAMD00019534_072290 [Acytostelium subglobosum LB1]|eukprot:XP_012753090.1 hypothetical protein SAMD00019534_072290 [Acytostelium subglobosum LB1]
MSWSRCSINGNKSMPVRCAHSSVTIASTNSIYTFGGWDGAQVLEDLIRFDIDTSSWDFPLPVNGKKPSKRAGHSCTRLSNDTSFIIFGGSDGEHYNSDVYLFDIDKMQWSEIQTTGTIPQSRSRHSATLVQGQNKVYIFGGSDGHGISNSLYVLDVLTWKWSIPNCIGDPPPATWGHTSFLYNNCLYFYGGCLGDSMSGNMNILNLSNHEWKVNVKVDVEAGGVAPVSRAGHSCTLYKDRAIVFGGATDNDKILNDTFVLDIEAMSWKKFSGDNTPTLRCAHTVEHVNNRFYIFGGSDGKHYFKDISILDADKVIAKIEQAPKKRVRLRPIKNSNDPAPLTSSSDNTTTLTSSTTTTTTSNTKTSPSNSSTTSNNNVSSSAKHANTAVTNSTPSPASSTNGVGHNEPYQPPSSRGNTNNSLNNSNNKVNNSNNNNNNHAPAPPQPPLSKSQTSLKIIPPSPPIRSTPPPPQPMPSKLKKAATPSPTAAPIIIEPRIQKPKQIIEWLQSINLSKYESNFIQNGITLDILDYLTEQHLIDDLKIPTLGARLKILNCIQLEKAKQLAKHKERDEKEVLRESIESLKVMADSLSASVQTLSMSLKPTPTHTSYQNGHTSPNLMGMNNGRGRRGSNAFEHPFK